MLLVWADEVWFKKFFAIQFLEFRFEFLLTIFNRSCQRDHSRFEHMVSLSEHFRCRITLFHFLLTFINPEDHIAVCRIDGLHEDVHTFLDLILESFEFYRHVFLPIMDHHCSPLLHLG